ncbi:hypothetical protein [Rhizobium paknamense]|uniref:Sulfotransferase n=1 Tax=Rhizobium paknamense TaxID=1206817 RepID=A0ABU0IAM7_9HYPH|nr:hypothetical protein [Rhizobium paknamense]MDQ0454299.1 hypothetical protein [Rhizobium paknamense]
MDGQVKRDTAQSEEQQFQQAMEDIAVLQPHLAHPKGMEALAAMQGRRTLEFAAALSHANPFFLPTMDADSAERLKITLAQLAELTFRARLTASRASQPNILVACAPKSASTFITAALIDALKLLPASLATPTLSPFSSSMLGANLRSQETDELALLRHGLNGLGYVAQHHIRCTPYLAHQMALYNIRPIVTIRNFFDTLVSLDDMYLQWHAGNRAIPTNFFDDGLPAHYAQMPFEERLDMLVSAQAVWYAQFLLSWQMCEKINLVKPLWVSYETDFLGDKAALAARIATFIGGNQGDAEKIAAALVDKRDGDRKRINRGVAGRGADVPQAVREKAMAIFDRYTTSGDMTPLVG